MTPTSFRCIAIVCLSTASTTIYATEKEPSVKFCASHKIALQAVSQHCANKFYKVFALKHENGSIGGYLLQPAIRDAPVSYLDCHGNFLVSLHVFGSDEEKAKANGIIEPLNTLFPRQEPLSCPVFESPAMPANEGT